MGVTPDGAYSEPILLSHADHMEYEAVLLSSVGMAPMIFHLQVCIEFPSAVNIK